MFLNITNSETGNNKGSSGALVHYLEKENRLVKQLAPEYWFNQNRRDVQAYQVRSAIDNNIAKLCRDEAKFFLLNICPSQKEIRFLKDEFGDNGAKEQLKEFAIQILDEYARNFKRPGIESSDDLLWFAKLENHRYYNHHDPEVKQGIKKRGEQKKGEQMHIQVIISRKDITNKIKLSPMNNSRGKNTSHSQKVGQFDRSAFKASGERIFDQKFRFERELTETFVYANVLKKGSIKERVELQRQMQTAQKQKAPANTQKITKLIGKQMPGSGILSTLLKPNGEHDVIGPKLKKHKKKRKAKLEQGLTL